MIVGCISGESRSLSGSPFKTLESFSFEGFVLYKADKTDKKRQELALLLFYSGPAKRFHKATAAAFSDSFILSQIPSESYERSSHRNIAVIDFWT